MTTLPIAIQSPLIHQLDMLNRLLEEIPTEVIHLSIVEGKWTIFQHVAHLGRYQGNFQERIQQILQKNPAVLGRYRAEEDPLFEGWLSLSFESVRKHLIRDRQELLHMIEGLSAADLKRVGVHPRFGKMNIPDWIRFFLLHESHHIYAIFRLRGIWRSLSES